MKEETIFSLDMPYREPVTIKAFRFGGQDGDAGDGAGAGAGAPADGGVSCAIVGSTRGNEVQQMYICAQLVRELEELERDGRVAPGARLTVIPCVNPISMNVSERFWPLDKTDINRMFPGYDKGETTQRIAAGVFAAVQGVTYGIQLCSFYMPGNFVPHVRVTHESMLSEESVAMARDFGLPYVVRKDPAPFDTTTLNYNWQVWDTHAFSVYSQATDAIDVPSARVAVEAILRFLAARGLVEAPVGIGSVSSVIEEDALVDVRTVHAGGIFMRAAEPGDYVRRGQELARIIDPLDAHVRDVLVSPADGYVFFERVAPLVQQEMVAFRLVRA